MRNGNDLSRILMIVLLPFLGFILIFTWKRWEKPNTSYLEEADVSILYLEYGRCPCQYYSKK